MAASKPIEAAMAAAAAPGSGNGVGGGGGTAGPGSGAGTLPRWHVALAIGAPLLLGAGAMYLWSRRRRRREAGGRGDASGLKRNSERKTPEGRASPALGSGHPDGSGDSLEMWVSLYSPGCPGTYSVGQAGLELRNPPASASQSAGITGVHHHRPAQLIVSKSESSLDRAQAAKNKGNKYFKAGKYEQAIQCYTEAISLCPTEKNVDLSTFYQNRAAAFEQLQKWKEVAQDCTKAVDLNPKYVKALFRRAKAHEKLDNKKECLEDVTAVCILEGFQNEQSMLLADKVLKLLGKENAKEKYKNREPLMPSPQFIKSYFSSFTDDIISQPMLKGEKSDEDKDKEGEALEVKENSGYLKAKQYMEEENYDKIISECSKEIDAQGKYMAEALLLRATFYLLIGSANAAKPDLDKVISLKEANVKLRANALIKRGTMCMQQQQPMLSTQDFNMAAEIDPMNSDVYHHRGQLKILLDLVEEAVADFDACIRLRPKFALAQAQKCFALYRQAYTANNSSQVQAAMKGFEEVIKKFPKCAEGYALYAQALTDQQQFGKADEMYDKCIDLEPDNATTYVHKGLLQLQWKQDLDKGLELISKAIEIDNKCDFAYETMGTIEVQRGNLEKAIDMFNKAINLAKSEMEMAHLYSLCDAAHAQTEVAKKYGLKPPTL
ncbi:Mitochondrial import receptor subunit TOM70 [Apodemus speciosus]|uniref:Mitochondrial import receptor subunit TOM70 n=1 Tax=Apodemus speciosus TaxID=105296 RepID=A0ABQ0FMS6_APOSI